MPAIVMPGANAWSQFGLGAAGVLVVHGFTGNPGSMRELAVKCADAGFEVELPRLAGHGTTVEEMIPTRWSDWSSDTEAAYQKLRERVEKIIVVGLSMGGGLTLWMAANHPDLSGIVCINPTAQPMPSEVIAGLQAMIDSGAETLPSIGSDIADPNAKEASYDATPTRALMSLFVDGMAENAKKYSQTKVPMLLINSVQDHVVAPEQSDYLVANYGGPIERVMLERSYHVATQDFEKQIVFEKTLEFARKVLLR